MNLFIRSYLLFCWAGAIFILIAWPMPEYNGTVISYYDKAAHVILFGVLAFLLAYLLYWPGKIKIFTTILLSLLFSSLYSIFCEHIQSIVPGRDVSGYDYIAGKIGILVSLIIFYGRYKPKKT